MRQKPNPDHHEGQESVGCFESGHHSDFNKIQVKSQPTLCSKILGWRGHLAYGDLWDAVLPPDFGPSSGV